MIYPAISIRQPWAYAILHLGKDVENRTRALHTQYIEKPILIHVGKSLDIGAYDWLKRQGYNLPAPGSLPLGGIFGVLTFMECDRRWPSVWAEDGMWHWVIDSAKPLPFHCCPGQLSFFNVDYPYEVPA
jgi:hypothetical protein